MSRRDTSMSRRGTSLSSSDVDKFVAQALYTGPSVTADLLVGVDSCLRQLAGQLALISRPELAKRFGLEPSGTLFLGPPGTGKTMLAKYLAGRLALPMYQFAADEFGTDPALIHAVFRRLSDARALVFIDEISILASRRDYGDAEERRMLSALLTSLDGLGTDPASRPWVIGACTPDIDLDPAIYRSGRLGVVVEFALPSEEQRRQLFKLYLAPVPNTVSEAEIARLAELATTATGADVHDWVNQAASEALADDNAAGEPTIEYRHLEAVVARRGFVAAMDRPGRAVTYEKCLHEAAHAVVAWALFGPAALAAVTVNYGRSPDAYDYGLDDGHFELSDDWLAANPPTSLSWLDHAAVALAGMSAEEVVLGYRGGGSSSDVAKASRIVLAQLDLADPEFGPSRHAIEFSPTGRPTGSEAMRANAWHLARPRFAACYQRTVGLVTDHRAPIERLAQALLRAQTSALTGEEILAVIDDARAPSARRAPGTRRRTAASRGAAAAKPPAEPGAGKGTAKAWA